MKKLDFGQSTALLANLGVIAGIVFLGIEIRGNTRATQAVSLQEASTADQEFLIHIGSNPDLTEIWLTFREAPDTLPDLQRFQGEFLMTATIRRLENVYLQYQLGALSENGWQSRQDLFRGIAKSQGYKAFLDGQTSSLANQQFLRYMNELSSSEE